MHRALISTQASLYGLCLVARVAQMQHVARPQTRAMSHTFSRLGVTREFPFGFLFWNQSPPSDTSGSDASSTLLLLLNVSDSGWRDPRSVRVTGFETGPASMISSQEVLLLPIFSRKCARRLALTLTHCQILLISKKGTRSSFQLPPC